MVVAVFDCLLEYVLFLQINEDLAGEVFFLAQTGPFSISLKCSTKKCDVSNVKFKQMLPICDIEDRKSRLKTFFMTCLRFLTLHHQFFVILETRIFS